MLKDGNISEDEEIMLWATGFQSQIFRFITRYCYWLLKWIYRFFRRRHTERAEKMHNVLSKSKRIDIIPSKHGTRAFTILIDQETALYFSQKDDKFVYDGWEYGNYKEKGKVTVFDEYKDE